MKNYSLAALALSTLVTSMGTLAAGEPPVPVQGGSGKISFSGVINNDACSVDGANADRVISVDMGNVSIKDMGSAEAPASGRVTSKDFNLNVNCNLGTKVSMVFDPTILGGSGIVTGKGVLALTPGSGAARTSVSHCSTALGRRSTSAARPLPLSRAACMVSAQRAAMPP